MSTRNLRRGLVALLAATLSIGAFHVGRNPTDRLPEIRHAGAAQGPWHAGAAARRAGLRRSVDGVPGGPQLLEGLNVGSIDFGVTGETPPVFAQAAGADLLYVAHEPPAPSGEAILVPKDSPIRSVAELKGKKIALNKGSNVHYLLVRALESAGLQYRDIQPVYLPPADARAAFERGSVDAWVIWDPFQAAAEAQLQRTLRDGQGLVSNHQFYLAARPFAERNPAVISTLIGEIRDIGRWVEANPDQATEQVAPLLGLSREITRKAVIRQGYGARPITPEVVRAQQRIADTFAELRLIPRKLVIQDAVWAAPKSIAQYPE